MMTPLLSRIVAIIYEQTFDSASRAARSAR